MADLRLWHPVEFVRACRRTFADPGDVVLALRVGWFLGRLPRRMARESLPAFLAGLGSRASSDHSPADATARIARVRQAWLNRAGFSSRNTCYARALTLYHFLPAPPGSLRFHVGVERGRRGERLRGHAWVSHRGAMLEAPDPVLEGRVETLWVHPS